MSAPLEMGAAVPLQRQKSLQSSILFMQEEHAKTLKALHNEIQHLQKKCSELTFSVAMGTTSSPQEDFYREKSETLTVELDAMLKRLEEVQESGEKSEKRVHTLEQQLRAQEKKFLDIIKNKDQQLRQMKSELTEKAHENATFMYKQLASSHDSALFRVIPSSDPDLAGSLSSSRGVSPAPLAKVATMTPHPPMESGSARRRRSPRALATAESDESRTSVTATATAKARTGSISGRPLRRPNTPEQVADATFFVDQQRTEQYIVCPSSTTKYNPLPPINSSGTTGKGPIRRQQHDEHQERTTSRGAGAGAGAGGIQGQGRALVQKHKRRSKHHKPEGTSTDQSTEKSSHASEVEKIVVDTVIKRDHKVHRTHEYHTDYN